MRPAARSHPNLAAARHVGGFCKLTAFAGLLGMCRTWTRQRPPPPRPLKAKAQFKARSTANNVEIYVPVPEDADSPKFKVRTARAGPATPSRRSVVAH